MAQSSYGKYKCSKCGNEETAPTKFCRKCGNTGTGTWIEIEPFTDISIQISKVCSVCRKKINEGDNFCPEHGATVIEEVKKNKIVYRG